jgi:hypothetical protein
MALKRWRWVWGPVLAALLVAIAVLPPRVPTRGLSTLFGVLSYGSYLYRYGYETQKPRSQFRDDVQNARSVQKWRLRRAILADSILTVARSPRALRSEDGQVTLVYEAPLTADSARVWLGAATRELALYPKVGTSGVALVVALLSTPARARPGNAELRYEWGVQALVDQAASAGACVVTVNLLRDNWGRPSFGHDLAGKPVTRVLGPCALYARFGLPGIEVSQWAAAGFGSSWWNPLTAQLLDARRLVRRYQIPRDRDWGNPWFGEVRWVEVGCLRGAAALCLRAAGLGRHPESAYIYGAAALARGQVMAQLLATGTPEQFAAFWKSPRPAVEALASAYGQRPAKLAMAAFEHWYSAPAEDERWGNAGGLAAGLAWVVLALALAVVAGRRWTIES